MTTTSSATIPKPVDGPRSDYLSWEEYFMSIAYLSSLRSKDPSTKVGACIVDNKNRIIGIGYNGFPTGCSDKDLPWVSGRSSTTATTNKATKSSGELGPEAQPDTENEGAEDLQPLTPWLDTKYPFICHAAINAILNSQSNLEQECTLYTTLFPNDECCKLIAQTGIKRVVYGDDKYHDKDSWVAARKMLHMANVKAVSFREFMGNVKKRKRGWLSWGLEIFSSSSSSASITTWCKKALFCSPGEEVEAVQQAKKDDSTASTLFISSSSAKLVKNLCTLACGLSLGFLLSTSAASTISGEKALQSSNNSAVARMVRKKDTLIDAVMKLTDFPVIVPVMKKA
ncbi:unnamed protein product [Amoebophrya sp. A120]|nr:unnamed protein product [Amoebophrya sp. A120]|eukprot:GSA120T00012577001.1